MYLLNGVLTTDKSFLVLDFYVAAPESYFWDTGKNPRQKQNPICVNLTFSPLC